MGSAAGAVSRPVAEARGLIGATQSVPASLNASVPPSAVLDPVGFVAAAALLADHGQRRLQRVEILDLALGVRDDLGEACDVLVEAGLVVPDFRRGVVIALRLHALGAGGKKGWELFDGVFELGHRGVDRSLIVGLFALDHRRQRAGVLAVALHHGLGLLDLILLRGYRADTKHQRSHNYGSSHHHSVPLVYDRPRLPASFRLWSLQPRGMRFIPAGIDITGYA